MVWGQGWVLCWLGVWASCRVVWVLRVRAPRSLWSLAGCSAEVRVGGGHLGNQAGLWSVGSGWLPVDAACRSATIKKVPTRTGPRCAPSACNPC